MNTETFPLYYETHGDQNHPCIILITGVGAQLIQWPQLLIQGLVDQGFYVITFDNRDSGLSPYYHDLEIPDLTIALQTKQSGKKLKLAYTLDDMATDVTHLMDHLKLSKAHILGISMGGMIAQTVALNYPERVASLILIATTSGDANLPPAKPEVLQYFSSSYTKKEKENLNTYVDAKTKLYKIYDPYYFNEDKARALHTKLYQRANYSDGFKRQLLTIIDADPRGDKLKQLSLRSLIIHGTDDPVFSLEHGKNLADCLTNSRLEVLPKMGHILPDELCPQVVKIIADFILRDALRPPQNTSETP